MSSNSASPVAGGLEPPFLSQQSSWPPGSQAPPPAAKTDFHFVRPVPRSPQSAPLPVHWTHSSGAHRWDSPAKDPRVASPQLSGRVLASAASGPRLGRAPARAWLEPTKLPNRSKQQVSQRQGCLKAPFSRFGPSRQQPEILHCETVGILKRKIYAVSFCEQPTQEQC